MSTNSDGDILKSKESYKHLLRKFLNILLKTDLPQPLDELMKKVISRETKVYAEVPEVSADLKRGCALDEHQKKAQEEAIICRNQ